MLEKLRFKSIQKDNLDKKCKKNMKISIFGHTGFIGSNMVKFLKDKKIEYEKLDINDPQIFEKNLGHVIYCIGVVGDFKERPFDTVESHVCLLARILKNCKFESFLYLSSTWIYSDSTMEEDEVVVNSTRINDLYKIAKLMGESLCLALNSKKIKIVRLSTVVGENVSQGTFLASVIHDAVFKNKIIVHMSPSSEKDYVDIDDVVEILLKIILKGKNKVYNVASGYGIKVKDIIDEIKKITNCEIHFQSDATERILPKTNISKIQNEFGFVPSSIFDKLKDMILFENKKKEQV